MNKRIRTGLLSAAIAGGTILGVGQIGGVANAQVDDTVAVEADAEVPEADAPNADARAARRSMRAAARQAVADLVGVDVETLRTELQGGATLADIAASNGVESTAVVELIVDQRTDRLAQAVENGRITQEQADEKLVDIEARVTTRVEEGRPERAEGDTGRRGPRGDRGPRAEAPADATPTPTVDAEG